MSEHDDAPDADPDELLARGLAAHESVDEALRAANFAAAEGFARIAVAALDAALGPDHPDAANAWCALGVVLKTLERLDDAAVALAHATATFDRDFAAVVDPGDDATLAAIARMRATCAAHRVDLLRLQGRLQAAATTADAAIARAAAELGDEDPALGALYSARGVVYKYLGALDDAALDYARAHALLELDPGADAQAHATLLHNIAGLHHERGDLVRAEREARRGIALRERAVGPDHPALAADLAALGPILAERGAWDEADATLVRAHDLLVAAFGERHHEVAVALANRAGIAVWRGDLARAVALYRAALDAFERIGDATRDHALALDGLALVVERRGDLVSAALYASKSRAMLEATRG